MLCRDVESLRNSIERVSLKSPARRLEPEAEAWSPHFDHVTLVTLAT